MTTIAPLKVAVRRMVPRDLENVVNLHRSNGPGSRASKVIYVNWMADGVSCPVVAEHDGRIVGNMVLEAREPALVCQALLTDGMVHPGVRGRRVYEQMFLHVMTACVEAGIPSCSVVVPNGNFPVFRATTKFGFNDTSPPPPGCQDTRKVVRAVASGLQESAYRVRLERIRAEQQTWFLNPAVQS